MGFIGMDVHRDFCEIAIVEPDGRARSAGRINTCCGELELFARSLAADDVVALEATSGAGLIGEIIEPHVAAVLVANMLKVAADQQGDGEDRPAGSPDTRPARRLRVPGDGVGHG